MLHIQEKDSLPKGVYRWRVHVAGAAVEGAQSFLVGKVPEKTFSSKKETIISLLVAYVTASTVNNVVNLYTH